MVSSSEVRIVCPSISFLFMRLGASVGVSHSFFPLIESFVFEGNSLSVVLADLLPLLRQSVNWFEGLVVEQRVMSEVRSSELETRLFGVFNLSLSLSLSYVGWPAVLMVYNFRGGPSYKVRGAQVFLFLFLFF